MKPIPLLNACKWIPHSEISLSEHCFSTRSVESDRHRYGAKGIEGLKGRTAAVLLSHRSSMPETSPRIKVIVNKSVMGLCRKEERGGNDRNEEGQMREVRPASEHHSWEHKCFFFSKQ